MIKIIEHNTETNEIIERQMTEQEAEFHFAEIAKIEIEKAESKDRQTARAALLERLGITEEEAKLLLG